VLDDPARLEAALRAAAAVIGATVVGALFHRFAPQGVTGVLLLSESHASVHSWPERGYAAVDVYTCGERGADAAVEALRAGLMAGRVEAIRIVRGDGAPRVV
jgi:S-adenosylmethionine decarboxylase